MYGVTQTNAAPVPQQTYGSVYNQQFTPVQQQPGQGLCTCGMAKKILVVRKQNENEGRSFAICPQAKGMQCPKSFKWMDNIPRAQRQLPQAPSVNLAQQHNFAQYRDVSTGPNGQFITPMKNPTITMKETNEHVQTRALVNGLDEKLTEKLNELANSTKVISTIMVDLTKQKGKVQVQMQAIDKVMCLLKEQNKQINMQLTTVKVQLNEMSTSMRLLNATVTAAAANSKTTTTTKTPNGKRRKTSSTRSSIKQSEPQEEQEQSQSIF